MPLKGKKAKKQADHTFNFRVNGDDWEKFKNLCDKDLDAKIPYSEALIEYILFAIKNDVLISSEDTFTDDGKFSIADDDSKILNAISELSDKVSKLEDFISGQNNSNQSTNTEYIQSSASENTTVINDDVAVVIADIKHEKKPDFNLANYLTRPDPLTPNPVISKSINQWATDTAFKAKAKEYGYGSTAPSIKKNLSYLGLVFYRKDKNVTYYTWHPENMVFNPNPVNLK